MGETNTAMMKAFVAVQKGVLKAVKDGKNPVFGSRYATLDSVLEAVREPLTENGFALVQDATTDMWQMTVSVVTRLLHESGGVIESQPLTAPLKKEFTRDGKELPPSVQQIGAAITYLRRYSLCPFLGVALDDDDDGNSVSQIGSGEPAQTAAEKPPAGAERRRSAHTGERLDTPGAVERHKAAAAVGAGTTPDSAARPPTDSPAAPASHHPGAAAAQPPAHKPALPPDARVSGAFNAALYEAIEASGVTDEELNGYLRGTLGQPRIPNPVLAGDMTIHTLGERIVNALLTGVTKDGKRNWDVIVARIKAARK